MEMSPGNGMEIVYPSGSNSPRPMQVIPGGMQVTGGMQIQMVGGKSPGPNDMVCVYECQWENCGYQFEELGDLIDHINQTSESGSHCQATNGEFICLWQGCSRQKKDVKPFPTAHRLVRHLKEVHLKQSSARRIKSANKAANYYPSSRRFYAQGQQSNDGMGPPVGMMSPSHNSNSMDGFNSMTFRASSLTNQQSNSSSVQQPIQQQQIIISSNPSASSSALGSASLNASGQPVGVALDPLFVAPPPKTHKALHSDIYLRYIENLAAKKPTLTDFHTTLAPRKNPPPALSANRNLPSHWFKDGLPPAHQNNVAEALWNLRDYMLKDALSLRPGTVSDYEGPL